jgi:hypothetical protein
MFRGTTKPGWFDSMKLFRIALTIAVVTGRDIEMQILEHFPGVPLFVGMLIIH